MITVIVGIRTVVQSFVYFSFFVLMGHDNIIGILLIGSIKRIGCHDKDDDAGVPSLVIVVMIIVVIIIIIIIASHDIAGYLPVGELAMAYYAVLELQIIVPYAVKIAVEYDGTPEVGPAEVGTVEAAVAEDSPFKRGIEE